MLDHQLIQRVLFPGEPDPRVLEVLAGVRDGGKRLSRHLGGESVIRALQRLLIFLGYSTFSGGSYAVDGDFGRGTNRGVAQFQVENNLPTAAGRDSLCYDCNYRTARKNITRIPDVEVDQATLDAMLEKVLQAAAGGQVTFGDADAALFHLNRIDSGRLLNCRQIFEQYWTAVIKAVNLMQETAGIDIAPAWVLAIIRQETAGVVRPRFEQHHLTKFNRAAPHEELAELRFRATSFGLGQVMGFNYRKVGAASARDMLYSPLDEQVLFVARFIAGKRRVVAKRDPSREDFRIMARYYNGPRYADHHYDESLATWFREFQEIGVDHD
ncbi:MAG TPA: DUF3380 domain-containing protein [Sedimenticola sp.]|nr:DUF3380 domain-containing protein [Sedimenticola sp.]